VVKVIKNENRIIKIMFGSQTNEVIYSSFAFIPIILILYYIYKKDRFPEPPRIVMITFFLGVATILPIQIFIPIIVGFGENLELSGESEHFYMAFVRAGFLEETAKWLVLIFYCTKLTDFNEPMDAIVYGVAVSLGFAAYENYDYVRLAFFEGGTIEASSTAMIRSISAVPLHALAGVFMGFFMRDVIFSTKNNKISLLLSLFFPICLHGFYNHIIISPNFSVYWIYILLFSMFVRAIFIFKKEKKLQLISINENAHIKSYEILNSDIFITIISTISLLMISTMVINQI